jgi:hypothetical protein
MNRLMIVRTYALAAVSAAALVVTPLAAEAQARAASATVPSAGPLVVAPMAASAPRPRFGPVVAPAGVVRAEAATTVVHLQNPGRSNRNVVWMIVGGGMLVGGTIIGDDVGTIISVTGLVIGLVGLFRYLQ